MGDTANASMVGSYDFFKNMVASMYPLLPEWSRLDNIKTT
jgi:hypothetical protein